MTRRISPASTSPIPLDSWVPGSHLSVPMKHFELTYRDGDDNQTKTINSFPFVSEPGREGAVLWMAQEVRKRDVRVEQIVEMNERKTT